MKVWLVRSACRKIAEAEAVIHETPKRVWACLPDGHRHVLGCSAFVTRRSAEMRKLGMLRAIVESKRMAAMWCTRGIYASAEMQLRWYKGSGVLQ